MVTEATIRELLLEVVDPEIPTISLVDLGVIKKIRINRDEEVEVIITPTFVGCPAIDQMKLDIESCLLYHGISSVTVSISYESSWSSDDITQAGKEALRAFGIAPPGNSPRVVEDLDVLERAECPNCGHDVTEMKNPFGPTLCRSIHYCPSCKETFEQFKPV